MTENTCNCNKDLSGLKAKEIQIYSKGIASGHPDWRAWAASCYKQRMVDAIEEKISRPDSLTEEELEQVCLALKITEL